MFVNLEYIPIYVQKCAYREFFFVYSTNES